MSKAPKADRSAVLWYSAERQQEQRRGQTGDQSPPEKSHDSTLAEPSDIKVDVLLFGLLSAMTKERPVTLTLPAKATAMDVVAALEDRFGPDIIGHVKNAEKGILPSCRIFVDGNPLEDASAPIAPEGRPATVEMILLKGFEGG